MNNWQKSRFVERVVSTMFNTVRGKKISILGFAFKKDTSDTRETPAVDVCKGLLDDGGLLSVFDPKVWNMLRNLLECEVGYRAFKSMHITTA